MGSQSTFDRISKDDFEKVLSRYPETVPSKLAELEEKRLSIIPARLTERKAKGNAYLTKDEVVTLVDWKLSHGTFRPSLKGLVQQNSEDFIEETTTAGFSADSVNDQLNILTKLKGIGPATAALLLSTSDPEKLPFFSDELFRWAFWEDKPGSRWDRKIKYSLKEYRELVARVDELTSRISKTALEAEKVAYVLGKEGTALGDAKISPKAQKTTDADEKPTQQKRKAHAAAATEDGAPQSKATKKQKASAAPISQRATRASSRQKAQLD
ncbi:hypothetical protein Q7P37_009035 [Cladosporium fusiforme]